MKQSTITVIFLSLITLLNACTTTDNKKVTPKETNQPSSPQLTIHKKPLEKITDTEKDNIQKKNSVIDKVVTPTNSVKKTKSTTVKTSKPAKVTEPKHQKEITKEDNPLKSLPKPELLLTSLDQIPFSLDNGWFINVVKIPLSTTQTCSLIYKKQGLFDGYKENNLIYYLTPTKLIIKSESNLDLTYPETGIYIEDKGEEIHVNSIVASLHPNIATSIISLNDFIETPPSNLLIKSGFWPSWPITETRTVSLPFKALEQMVTTFNICTSLLASQ